MTSAAGIMLRAARALLLIAFVAAGTVFLVRFAPGYYSDTREMDAKYATGARTELAAEELRSGSASTMARHQFRAWLHGDLGQSRQYEVPVAELLHARLAVSALLLLRGIGYGWLLACCFALPFSAARRSGGLLAAPFTILLAIPTAALATACILADTGGPALVLTLLIAVRDFKFAHRLLLGGWRTPHLLQARAAGVRTRDLIRLHLLPGLLAQLLAIARMSLVTALGSLVPIEVVFNVPGVGQLAWNAVMNRDLPVMLAVTLLMTAIVSLAGIAARPADTLETA